MDAETIESKIRHRSRQMRRSSIRYEICPNPNCHGAACEKRLQGREEILQPVLFFNLFYHGGIFFMAQAL